MAGKRIFERIKSINWVFPISLVSLIYILDVRYFSSPPLYSDDWSIRSTYIFGQLKTVDWADRRPFGFTLESVLTPILGVKFQYHYLLNFLIILLSGLLLYIIIRRAFPQYSWLPLPVALIYLIYPVDYTKTWIIMLGGHLVLLIDLLVIFLLMDYAKSGRIWQLLLALLLFLFSLGSYESGLGIVMAAAILLAGVTRKITIKRRLAILSVLLVGAFFIVWRTTIQQNMMNIQDNYLDQLNTNVMTIFSRYIQGLFIFIFNWIGPLLSSLGRTKYIVFVIIVLLLIGVFLAFLPRLIRSAKSNNLFDWHDKKTLIRSLLLIFLVGGLFWAAGYIPIISLRGPSFDGVSSRDNLFAIPGASLALVAALSCLIVLIAKSVDRVRVITISAVIPLLVLGSFYQLWSQNESFKAWNEQKQFWNLMFEAIPGLKDDSEVIIVIPGYNQLRQFQIMPFSGNWEARSALKLLYNNPSLQAIYYYPNLPHEKTNLLSDSLEWSNCVFVYYDPAKSSLEIIDQPEDKLSLSFQLAGYDPRKRIIDPSLESQSYRWLVK